MLWLAQQGHPVLGVELSQTAVEAFFAEADAPYQRRQAGLFQSFEGQSLEGAGIEILCGDFFELMPLDLVGVAGVFDRGSLVALPQEMRHHYAEHLLTILPLGAQILLLTIEYDQSVASGPPFAVHPDEVTALFGARCAVSMLDSAPGEPMPPRFQAQGIRTAGESTYRIVKER